MCHCSCDGDAPGCANKFTCGCCESTGDDEATIGDIEGAVPGIEGAMLFVISSAAMSGTSWWPCTGAGGGDCDNEK